MNVPVRIAVAAVCLVLGVAAALLATDVLRWQSRIAADDTRLEAGSTESDLWKLPRPFLPGAAESLLGLGDDLAYRRALREFALGRPREETFSDTQVISQRGRAQERLGEIVNSHQPLSRRAAAANLMGVLGFANAAIDPSQAPAYLESAVASFRQAIALDPSNADAKYNLELALTRLPPARQAAGQSPAPKSQGGSGSGAGSGRAGSGY